MTTTRRRFPPPPPEPDPELKGPEEHKDIEWDDDFVPWQPGRIFHWDLIADQLRQRPGKWARITGATGYQTLVTAVKKGTGPVALRDGFQAASRRGEIWMR